MRRVILSAVCLFFGAHLLWGQLSTQHYIPPVPDLVFDDAFLYVSTPHPNVTFTLKPVGGTANPPQTITNANSAKISLSSTQVAVDPNFFPNNQTYYNRGYILTADREVYVSLRLKTDNHAGALVSKGIDGLGKSFRVGGMERKEEYVPFVALGDWSFFSIMATKDATIVNFEDVDPLLVAENLNGSLPATITLDEGETYLALFNGQNNERFIGTHVKSQNHDIIVNSGSIIGSFSDEIIDINALPNGLFPGETTAYLNGSDMGFDQMVSLDASVDAKEYLLIKGDSFDSIENALVIANEPNTAIYLNGSSTVYTTLLNAGDHVFIEGNEFVSSGGIGYLQISANKNIYVFQGTGKKGANINGAGTIHWYGANQGMFFVPPLSCTSVGDVESVARINEVDAVSSFDGSLFVLSTDGSIVYVNGLDINSYTGVQTTTGLTADSRSYQIHRLDNLTGDVSVVGSEELYVSYYNFNGAATSGAFYSGFTLEPRIYPEITLNALGVCFDPVNGTNVTLSLPNYSNYDSWKWQKQDTATGTWSDVLPGISDPETYVPAEYGIYRLEVTINCLAPNDIVYSDPLTVSVCPPDFDNDGIINNIDLDNDNDGILDAVESYGNFEVDLTLSPPQINAAGVLPSSVPDLQETLTTANGIFTPSTNGSFTSFLPIAGLSSSKTLVYELKPVNPGAVHLKFVLDGAIPSENEVSYILESVDPSESITLLNPSDELELLMNGVYVGGQTQFSGSKIEFRFNPAMAGTDPADFSFIVYNTSGLKFTHINESTANDSTFNGVFEVINLDRFSDGDVSPDIFDADSDNDNCPDVLEAGFTDGDNDEKVLVGPLTFDDGAVDEQGRVIGHNYALLPADADTNGNYDFQEIGTPAEIDSLGQPASQLVCEGGSAVFQVNSPTPNASFQWQIDGVDLIDDATFSGATSNILTINNADVSLDGAVIQVMVTHPTYQCPTVSNSGVTLSVNAIPDAPTVDAVYTFCEDDAATVGDLKANIGGALNVYPISSGGLPLTDETPLVHDQTYHISAIDALGCESLTRAETEVFLSAPVLAVSTAEICLGETVTLSVDGVPQTAQDFENANPDFEKFLTYNGSSYFLKRQSMPWEDAYTLIQSLGAGASMYVINETAEEDAVFDALNALGVTGTDEIHFWLGLRQVPALNTTPPTVDGGWQWLDGRMLDPSQANWSPAPTGGANGEPNDSVNTTYIEDGEEDYAQFDFFDVKRWNDMQNVSVGTGNSWPVFEFTGTTDVVWGKIDPLTGNDIVFSDVETSSIEDSPLETTTYFYEVTTNGVTCRKELSVVVHPLPILPMADDMLLCDDDTDGDDRNGQVQGFDFLAQESDILTGLSDYEVQYYTDPNDETTLIDKTLPFENTSNPQPIYFRLTNTLTGCVSDTTGAFNLQVLGLPPDIDILPHYQCDDPISGSDADQISTFDLLLNTPRILALLGDDGAQYEVSYHRTDTEADDPSSTGIISYTTTPTDAGQKTIYVRITDKLSPLNCDYSKNQFDLIIGALPVLDNPLIIDEECDETDGVSDGLVVTNLRAYEHLISYNFANEVFAYYTSPSYDSSTLISDPTSYINEDITDPLNPVTIPNPIIYVTIYNIVPTDVFAPGGSCTRFAEIDLSVGASQIDPTFNLDFFACETDPSVSQDGIVLFSADVFTQIDDALRVQHPQFNAMNVSITYYPSENDAALEQNQIDVSNDYNNQYPVATTSGWTSEIWANVEVESFNIITCIGFAQVATLYVERLPTAHPVDTLKVCDNDNDATNFYNFDTSTVNPQLLMGQTDVSVSFWDTNGNLLFTDALPNPFLAPSQTLIARVENSPSSNTPACYEEVSFEFVIDDTPDFYTLPYFVLCDDSDGLIDNEAVFDTRNLEATILNGQVGMEVFYYDPLGNALSSPLPEDFKTGFTDVTVEIINPANPSCPAVGVVSFVVYENPSFVLDYEAVLCLNEGSMFIGLSSPANVYTYAWELNGTPLSHVTEEIEIFQGGTYTVTATSADGCTTSKSIFVLESELAQLNQQALIVSDLTPSGENTVTVDVSVLGVGDYEYALDYGPFQDNPTFENIRPGIHVLAARDKNSCGTAYIDLAVIGYYKYFSPNNDGVNDYWKVLGINDTFYNTSKVYVFDRYGRLLSQLQNDSPGWDGTFKGSPLPADDYWFRVELDDGRTFDGHFSLMR